MKHMKALLVLATVCASASISTSSFADLKVCNKRSSTMWVTDAMYRPKQTKIVEICSTSQVANGSSCYWTAWEVGGWYSAAPNQCVTTWIGNITNRYVGIRAEFADGATVSGNQYFFDVQYQSGFAWDEFTSLRGSSCVVGSGVFDPCSAQPVSRGFYLLDVGSATNYTLNIT
jgi:uncharacterized membrane protein